MNDKAKNEKAVATTGRVDLVNYTAKDGTEVRLTGGMVKDFMVRGRKELISTQEILFFEYICQSRGLNPLTNDVYLLKYTSDPAAIIIARDYFRAHAKSSPDCEGWKFGIIVRDKDSKAVRDSAGLILPEDELLGGWFECQPKGWKEPVRLEVNLAGYIKRTKDGSITKFWKEENQPTMIAKVAECQGLRYCFPKLLGKIYTEGEIIPEDEREFPGEFGSGAGAGDAIDTVDQNKVHEFDLALKKWMNQEYLDSFVEMSGEHINGLPALVDGFLVEQAKYNEVTVDELKVEAALGSEFAELCEAFRPYIELYIEKCLPDKKPEKTEKTEEKTEKAETVEPEVVEDEKLAETLIADFVKLQEPGLRKFEYSNRDEIAAWPTAAMRAFIDKWQRVCKTTYVPGHGEVKDEDNPLTEKAEKEEKKSSGNFADRIECPDMPDILVSKAYCDKNCKQERRCKDYNIAFKN
ncbi:MAG: recombinase RecT [Deltaproteobacteria bacterium]|nr:recombinase RecT [Deltaproteobacteria bacterium]